MPRDVVLHGALLEGTGTQMDKPHLENDPVCGMSVDSANPPARVELGDHHVGFCSAGCRETFLADPERYAADRSTR